MFVERGVPLEENSDKIRNPNPKKMTWSKQMVV